MFSVFWVQKRERERLRERMMEMNFGYNISLGVSICLHRVSIESLDLNKKKKLISTVEKISTVWKTTSRQSRFSRQFKIQVSTVSTTLKIEISRFSSCLDRESRSRQKKADLDSRENLDSLKSDISTWRTFSISIAIECRDPQAYYNIFKRRTTSINLNSQKKISVFAKFLRTYFRNNFSGIRLIIVIIIIK